MRSFLGGNVAINGRGGAKITLARVEGGHFSLRLSGRWSRCIRLSAFGHSVAPQSFGRVPLGLTLEDPRAEVERRKAREVPGVVGQVDQGHGFTQLDAGSSQVALPEVELAQTSEHLGQVKLVAGEN